MQFCSLCGNTTLHSTPWHHSLYPSITLSFSIPPPMCITNLVGSGASLVIVDLGRLHSSTLQVWHWYYAIHKHDQLITHVPAKIFSNTINYYFDRQNHINITERFDSCQSKPQFSPLLQTEITIISITDVLHRMTLFSDCNRNLSTLKRSICSL